MKSKRAKKTEKAELQRILYPCDVKIGGEAYPVYILVSYEDGRLDIMGSIGSLDPSSSKGWGQINYRFRSQTEREAPGFVHYEPKDLSFRPGWRADAWLDLLDTWQAFHLCRADRVPSYVHDWLRRLPD